MKMLDKEECINAKSDLQMANDYPNSKYNDSQVIDNAIRVFFRLIKEHFELVKKYDKLNERHSKTHDDVHDYRYETQSLKIIIRNLCKHFGVESEKELQNIYLNKPYKFEDLKVGMWVWNDKYKYFIRIIKVREYSRDIEVEDASARWYEDFEEGIFFPPTKAMDY